MNHSVYGVRPALGVIEIDQHLVEHGTGLALWPAPLLSVMGASCRYA